LELYFTGSTLEKAIENVNTWFEQLDDSKVKWGKTGSREKVIQDYNKAVKNYFEEMPDYNKILTIEEDFNSDIQDKIDGKEIKSPIPFNGKTDMIFRDKNKKLKIEDYKFVSSFSSSDDHEKPAYIFQAFFYYYLVRAKYNEEPEDCTFREIKISTNKDGSSQHNLVVVKFSGEKFEENKVYFWYYVSSMLKLIENTDHNSIFLFNIFDSVYGADNFVRLKETVFGYSRDEVKNNEFTEIEERGQKEVKYIESKEASTIQDKIRVKFQDYGVPLKFASIESGYSYDRYLFEP